MEDRHDLPEIRPAQSAVSWTYNRYTEAEREYRRQQFQRRLKLVPLYFLRILLAFIIVGSVAYLKFVELPFDSAQWKAESEKIGSLFCPSVGERMAWNLIKRKKLEGLQRSQVCALLALPEGKSNVSKASEICCEVGGNPIERIFFCIKFDSQQRVVSTYLRRLV